MTSEKIFMEMDECSEVPMSLLRHATRNRRNAAQRHGNQRTGRAAASTKHRYAATMGEFALAVGQ